MTNEKKTEDKNLVIAWFTVGLLILGCLFFAFMGKGKTNPRDADAVAAANDNFDVDLGTSDANSSANADTMPSSQPAKEAVPSVSPDRPSTPVMPTRVGSSTAVRATQEAADANSLSAETSEVTATIEESPAQPTSTLLSDTDATSPNGFDSEINQPADVAINEAPGEVAADIFSAENAVPESAPESQISDIAALTDTINEAAADGGTLGATTQVEDPLASTDAQNGTLFDDIAPKLSETPAALDNSALAESPITDIADTVIAETGNAPTSDADTFVATPIEQPASTLFESAPPADPKKSLDIVPSNVEQSAENTAAQNVAPSNETQQATGSAETSKITPVDTSGMRPFLGVGIRQTGGSVVTTMYDNSTAKQLGLKLGDRISKINGKPITNLDSIKRVLATMKVGDSTKLTFVRNEVTIRVGPVPLTGKKKQQ